MARFHGSTAQVYVNGSDLSAQMRNVTPKIGADAHDATTFASNGWKDSDPGLKFTELGFEVFHDAAASQEDPVLAALVGTDDVVVSVVVGDADALGDDGVLIGAATLEGYELVIDVEELLKKTGTFKGSGSAASRADLLHVLGQETVTANGSSIDGAASSSNGARANLHITAISGTWTIKVQDSADDAAWADHITFSSKTAAGGATGVSTGTVDRYLRVRVEEDVAGSVTFALTVARL